MNKIFPITWGFIEQTITPMSPAHWLAENFDKDAPTPTFPPKAMAAANGSHAVATSAPYFMADSMTLHDSPCIWCLKLMSFLIFFPMYK